MNDPVNNPSHYTSHPSGVECIQITEHMTYNIGNAIAYLWRNGLKEGQPAEQDLRKAVWHINREIERISSGDVIESPQTEIKYRPMLPWEKPDGELGDKIRTDSGELAITAQDGEHSVKFLDLDYYTTRPMEPKPADWKD